MHVAQLADVLRDARVYDLGQTLSASSPHHPNYPPFTLVLQYRHGDWWTPCRMTFASELIITTGHTGTHIDGLGHTSDEGRLKDRVDAFEIQKGGRGLQELGIETMAPFLCRGVLLDVASHRDVDVLPDDYVVAPEDLEATAERQQVEVLAGDAVLLRTGRGRFWEEPKRFFDPHRSCPGPGPDAVEWLFGRGIALTGSDTVAYEFLSPELGDFGRGHNRLLGGGVPIVECLNLEALAAEAAFEFVLFLSPLRIVGGTGSPVRPLAVVPMTNAA